MPTASRLPAVGPTGRPQRRGLEPQESSLRLAGTICACLSLKSPCSAYADSDQHHIVKEAAMSETWSGEFYCVKCKDKRETSGEVHVSDKGTRMAKGICPVCGTKLNRILGKA
jgi:hypothetical protein